MEKSKEYKERAERLIRELPEFKDLKDSDVRIEYLISQREKRKDRKIIYGECHKVSQLYSWCCPYDFFIVIYEPNVAGFTNEQIDTLLRHELHHIGIDYSDLGMSYYIVPHDVEEFWEIINDCGLDWSDMNAER
ncbi:MAG: hypothetical protein IJL97_03810 [Lachnospiraceae bacterium]|nr:hypothetical protein [Clostridia bacterium]MBR0085657.1 hypothetical protein [Lachnospiraceae bacterium]